MLMSSSLEYKTIGTACELVDYLMANEYLSIESSWPCEKYTCLKRVVELLRSNKWRELRKDLRGDFISLLSQIDISSVDIESVWSEGFITNEALRVVVWAYLEALSLVNTQEAIKQTHRISKNVFLD